MKVRVETVGVAELQGRAVVLGTATNETHTALVAQAVRALDLTRERDDQWFRYAYTYRLKPSADGGAFPPDATVADMIRAASPDWAPSDPSDYDATIRLGRFYAFCCPGKATDADLMGRLGLATPPAVVSRFGSQASATNRYIDGFALKAPEFRSTAAVATDRLAYAPGDSVAVFALALQPREAASGTARIELRSAGRQVPGYGGELKLLSGLGVSHLDGLPVGQYTASFKWERCESQCTFTVGDYTRSAAEAVWLEGPRISVNDWSGTVALSLYGAPLPAGIDVDFALVSNSQPGPRPITFKTEPGGLVSLRVPNTHPDCRVMGCTWQDGRQHTAQLPLMGSEGLTAALGVRAMTAPHEGSERAAGLHVSLVPEHEFPLRLEAAIGRRVKLVASRDLDVAAWTSVFPSHPLEQASAPMRAGDEVFIDLPARCGYGFLYVGALAGQECFEASLPIFAPTELTLQCAVPEVARAGSRIKIAVGVNDAGPVAATVVVRDSRQHAGGGLEAAAASARLATLNDEYDRSNSQAGRLSAFSECFVSATLAMDCECETSPKHGGQDIADLLGGILGGRGRDIADLLGGILGGGSTVSPRMNFSAQRSFVSAPSRDNASPAAAPAPRPWPSNSPPRAAATEPTVRTAPRELAQPSERLDTLFSDVVLIADGRAEIEMDVPAVPAGYTVEVLAVDPEFLGWVTYRTTFRAQRPVEVYADTLPSCVSHRDAGRVSGTIAIATLHDAFELEATRDGTPVPCYQRDGAIVAGEVKCIPGQPTEIVVPIEPGTFEFTARSGGERHAVTAVVRSGDRISERVCRLHVLESGAEFRVGPRERLFDLRFAPDPDELFRTCGAAVANYEHACCEQTAAKMLGAWLAYAAGDEDAQFRALGTLREGTQRLESMWRAGGFAMYPDQENPHSYWGPGAYRHLCEMRPMFAALSEGSAANGDAATTMASLTGLTVRAAKVYGPPVKNAIASCQDAYLVMPDRHDESLAWVASRWHATQDATGVRGEILHTGRDVNPPVRWWARRRAPIPHTDGAVNDRAENCYASAVLLSDAAAAARHQSELLGTLKWIGGQLRSGGRLYSTIDSAALVAFLSAARSYGLMSTGKVRLDGGPEMTTAEASRVVGARVPASIQCTEGQVHLLVDGVFERPVSADATHPSLSVGIEVNGRRRERLSLGEVADLVVNVGRYDAGMFAHIVLPPCLAYEQGGVRLQSFQRDLEGRDHVRLTCRAVSITDPQGEHGLVVVRNMFVEEQIDAIDLEVTVTTRPPMEG